MWNIVPLNDGIMKQKIISTIFKDEIVIPIYSFLYMCIWNTNRYYSANAHISTAAKVALI